MDPWEVAPPRFVVRSNGGIRRHVAVIAVLAGAIVFAQVTNPHEGLQTVDFWFAAPPVALLLQSFVVAYTSYVLGDKEGLYVQNGPRPGETIPWLDIEGVYYESMPGTWLRPLSFIFSPYCGMVHLKSGRKVAMLATSQTVERTQDDSGNHGPSNTEAIAGQLRQWQAFLEPLPPESLSQ